MYKDIMRGIAGAKISEPELVLMSVAAMSDNRSAFDRLRRARFDAVQLLREARQAGRQLAIENGFHETVKRFYGRLPKVSAEALSLKPTPEKAIANLLRQTVTECLAAARDMPAKTRTLSARDLAATYAIIDKANTPKEKARALRGVKSFAIKRQNDASRDARDAPDNPLWNVASCIENIAHAEIAAMKLQDVVSDTIFIRNDVQAFIAENIC